MSAFEERQTIYFKTYGEHWTTRERDPEDSWDNGSTSGFEWCISAHLTNPGYPFDNWTPEEHYWYIGPYDTDFSAGEIIYVVEANYGTGNTFGSSGGYLEIVSVFRNEWMAKMVSNDIDRYIEGYAPWIGYFEWLQDICVKELTLEP